MKSPYQKEIPLLSSTKRNYEKPTYKCYINIKHSRITLNDNEYFMGVSSIACNKLLMLFKGTDPEYSVEDYLNAVTAKYFHYRSKTNKAPLHQIWIHRRTVLIQTTFDGAAQKRFSALPTQKLILFENNLPKNFQKCSTLEKTNDTKEFYAIKIADSQTKR